MKAKSPWLPFHGVLLLGALTLPAFVPVLARWPWYFLGPLALYGAVVIVTPPLRHSVGWLTVGRMDAAVLGVTAGIVLISSGVLILYYRLFHPDLHELVEMLPIHGSLPLILAGVLFAVTNALTEEIIFRGILQEALASQLGGMLGILIQALAFGFGHARGYPPGEIGIVLAGLYGLLLGFLREWTGGLGAPFLAHIFADATIFAIVVIAG